MIDVPPLAWPSDAVLAMPGSKSDANRLLVAAALCGRDVVITGVTASDDVRHLARGLRTLGFAVQLDADTGRAVVAPRGAGAPAGGELCCGNAGTALRFLVSVAAITPGQWTITGDDAMRRRPIGPLVDAWRQLGVQIDDTNGCPPVRVRGTGDVRGGLVRVDPTASGQFVSSLLLVGAMLPDGLRVVLTGPLASAGYVGMTTNTLRRFGVRVEVDPGCARVEPGHGEVPRELAVTGDWSSAGVWACLDHLTGSRVRAANLAPGDQPDEQLLPLLRTIPPHGACTIDVAAVPDQFCNLAIVAAHRAGTTALTGGANLRVKECDRIAVMARELCRLGALVDERPDGLVVHGGRPLRGGTIDPANDHRIAMAFALAGLLSPGVAIADAGCVAKSYPRFWQHLDAVVRERRTIAVVGMRGAGKSTFAAAFAARTGARLADSDVVFTERFGGIAAYVERHGWPAFRAREQALVAELCRPGTVLATGGGAVETAATRSLLRERALVVWLAAGAASLQARLRAEPGARPSVTGAPALDEIPALLARRDPLYAELAHLRVDGALPADRQVEVTLRALGERCRWPGDAAPR